MSAVPKPKSKKRAAKDEGGLRKRRKSVVEEDDSLLDFDAMLNKAFARMDSQLLADYMAQKTSRFGGDLSSIELSDLYISANSIKDTTSWDKPRSLANLPDFLQEYAQKPESLDQAPGKSGSPRTVIVTGAGLRAADIVRAMRKFQKKGNTITKLFAKHIKIEEQVKFLSKAKTSIGVGTPVRLMDLIDNGALSLENLERIVVDASHIDQKKRGVLDMKETMLPLAQFLARKELKDRYVDAERPLDLIFY